MAFSGGIGDRSDDLCFQSPLEDSFSSVNSPLRGIASQIQSPTSSGPDSRALLPRRFTTNTVPTLPTPMSPIGLQRRQVAESTDFSSATYHKVQLLEKKKLEYESLREQRRRFEAAMEKMDLQAKRDEEDMNRLACDITRSNVGHQSEPTTPPEYRDTGFPSVLSKPNRFSTSNTISPPYVNRGCTNSQRQTPPGRLSSLSISHVPSKSVPGSRRNSDEEEEDTEIFVPDVERRSAAAMNRKSMPVTGLHTQNNRSNGEMQGLYNTVNAAKYLFSNSFGNTDEETSSKQTANATSPETNSYLQMTTESNFPILVRRGSQLSAPPTALDPTLSASPDSEGQSSRWPSVPRHRQAQHSLPMNVLYRPDEFELGSPIGNGMATPTPKNSLAKNRRSLEVKFSPFSESKVSTIFSSPQNSSTNGMPKSQGSHSINDIQTSQPNNNISKTTSTTVSGSKSHAEQHLHKHNASMGRFPPSAMSSNHNREISNVDTKMDEQKTSYQPMQSILHASAPSFGPSFTTTMATSPNNTVRSPVPAQQYSPGPHLYNGYSMPLIGVNGSNASINPQVQWPGLMPMYGQHHFPQYGASFHLAYSNGRYPDSQARVIQHRRMQTNEENNNRFANTPLEEMAGDIYNLCRDQHGCRFLQKKLEERDSAHVKLIFNKTKEHVRELMIDPFGNYLCQKLLEHTNIEQRTVLINNASESMVSIALNQHGTRALQKMIESISTPEQVETITNALKDQVVTLIQDLNGNHVIQKCLNHLTPKNAQFIFEAVGENCVVVGTHRHGCCVLQRCIDHASGDQKAQLVNQITSNAFALVQDPFGNYVVQYILDLNEPAFTQPLCHGFQGNIPALSKHKFSSNVIEKCIRVADPETRHAMIEELLQPHELEQLIRDSFGNYVIQTAMDWAEPETKTRLVDGIRPLLPAIRTTPYGRRIQSKIQDREPRVTSGAVSETPAIDAPPITQTTPRIGPQYQRQIATQGVGFNEPGNAIVTAFHNHSKPWW